MDDIHNLAIPGSSTETRPQLVEGARNNRIKKQQHNNTQNKRTYIQKTPYLTSNIHHEPRRSLPYQGSSTETRPQLVEGARNNRIKKQQHNNTQNKRTYIQKTPYLTSNIHHEPRRSLPYQAFNQPANRGRWENREDDRNHKPASFHKKFRNTDSNHHCPQTNNKNWENKKRQIGFKTLEELANADAKEILLKISEKRDPFMELIQTQVKRPDVFVLVVKLISKVCQSSFDTLKLKLLIDICHSQFMANLQMYLLELPYVNIKTQNNMYWRNQTEFWTNFITFCECIITMCPSIALQKCRSLIETCSKCSLEGLKVKHEFNLPDESLKKLDELRLKLTLPEQVNELKEQKKKFITNEEFEPPQSFRELSVVPSAEDILERHPFVRPNLVNGAYKDLEHYLDVQFRLLREDCYGPLREGIHQYMHDPTKYKYDNIRIFRNVKFVEPYISNTKTGFLVQLDNKTKKTFKNVKWAYNKRFIYGSLVLFTKDNCNTFIIGTVLDREPKYLNEGLIPVSLVDVTDIANLLLSGDTYTMIESEVYFEPYYHVLNVLKDSNFPKHLAMTKYIVQVDPQPKHPSYISLDTSYDVKCDDLDTVTFDVLHEETWPSNTKLRLNKSQLEAFKLALTHEFAVIQGPPGTGKTYLGVKIAQTLIENLSNTCNILLICYTNHALDQFLEAILPITKSVARIGGQSRSEKLNMYNLNNLRRTVVHENKYFYDERHRVRVLNKQLKQAQECLYRLKFGVISFNCIKRYVPESHVLGEVYYKTLKKEDPLQLWLFENLNYNINQDLCDIDEDHIFNLLNDEYDTTNERNNIILDDWEDDDLKNEITLVDIEYSFSLIDAINRVRFITNSCNTKDKEAKRQKLLYECAILRIQIKHFRDMSMLRQRSQRAPAETANLLRLSTEDRWLLYFRWADIILTDLVTEMKKLQESFASACNAYEETRMMTDQKILKNIKVIGMTTSGAARLRKMVLSLASPIVIVEEAAEVLEQHIITSLTENCQHLILIGDHKQLRPSASHMKLARHYNIEVSLFERMIMNNIDSRRLAVQHRMRPEIAALIAPHIYPDLMNHPSVENFPDVRGITHNLFFVTHNYKEEIIDNNSSKANHKEADMVLKLANYLMQQDYDPSEITILAAYSGQLFYMKRERACYSHLAKVKITVVDNYQGEESNIILLSLVRNNDEDKIGFLETENRICVALSRARHGLYIFGNIDILRKNSPLWEKIAGTLGDKSLGGSLRLRCENHPNRVTVISNPDDFQNVPEGGCTLKCNYNLRCGHQCPIICHGYDRGHIQTKCTEKCERVVCELGHVCPLMCAVSCEPCKVLVSKELPCNHMKSVACYLDPTDKKIKCLTQVSVKLPHCGHEAKKVCSLKIECVVCTIPCIYRVEQCGHLCQRLCHVNHDPNHVKYLCSKPCARAKKGCKAELIGDRGNHQCNKKCHEACDDCTVEVMKKRSNCKHSERVACCNDVNDTPCTKKCARSLPCGHFCMKKCYETCGDCKQKVIKEIPECKHKITVRCMDEVCQKQCTKNCERKLFCGHPCQGLCKDKCDDTECNVTVQKHFLSPCGHKVQLPCKVLQVIAAGGNVEKEVFLQSCKEPCNEVLACGHLCRGSCSECLQGRVHAPCKQICHQINICGHQCLEPCNQVCPPCEKQCEVKCSHSHCNKRCGEPCTPCQETCTRRCKHGACSRRCSEDCDWPPCDAACPLNLVCGHACRGLCGEPCPEICNACDPDGFPKDFLGDEYEHDARFIKLQDCTHFMEKEEFDRYMAMDKETVAIRTCPFCRTPIINTHRYKDIVNKMIKDDINPVKERVYGTVDKIIMRNKELKAKIDKFVEEHFDVYTVNQRWGKALNSLKHHTKIKGKKSLLNLDMCFVYLDVLEIISEIYNEYEDAKLSELQTELNQEINLICNVIKTNIRKISQQQQQDIGYELKRLNSIVQLAKILGHAAYFSVKTVPEVAKATAEAKNTILGWQKFHEEKAIRSLQELKNAVKLKGVVTKRERDLIVQAIGLKAGHWYKCPNGHFYCIGECGGAMEVAKCNECGANIGGQSHRLLSTNAHAPEMDGSKFPVWSEQYNNMANFDLN